MPVIFDSGATLSVTPFMSDIKHGWRSEDIDIHGLSATTKCLGTGFVQWEFINDEDRPIMIEVLAFCVPASHIKQPWPRIKC